MFQIALCDDDRHCLELLDTAVRTYCAEHHIDIKIHTFNDSDILATLIEKGRIFDAYILDIEMQEYSGLDLVKLIREYSDMACIIFLTAHSVYAIEACGMNLFRYILKEQLNQELPRTLRDLFTCLSQLHREELYLISNQRRFIKIPQKNIMYIYKKQKNAVFVLTNGKEISERCSLQEVYKKLNNKNMIVLDRGVILNLWHVQSVLDRKIQMDNGYEISTNSAHIEELKRTLNAYWGKMI